MKMNIALILLLSTLAVSARSLEGYKCKEYPVVSSDPFSSLRTVRICEVVENGAPPARFQMASEAEDLVKPSLSANILYNTDTVWPRQVLQHTSKSWPLQSYSYNNVKEQFLPMHRQTTSPSAHIFHAFNEIGLDSSNPSSNNNELNTRNLMGIDRSMQQQLNTLVRDVSEVKDSITHLVPYLKNILDALMKNEENVNVNLKLDPTLEALLKQFFQLTESSKDMNEDQTTNNVLTDIDDEETTKEDSSEENTTEVPTNFSDSSTEQEIREDSEEVHISTGENSLENVDSWIRRRFGPRAKPPASEEEMNKTSEEENSAEKSNEESFETWFNYVYRKIPDEPTNESRENEQNQSKENSKEGSEENSKEIDENSSNGDADVNYRTVFIPKTFEEAESSEYLQNGDRYDYTTERNNNLQYVKPNGIQANECIRIALSISTFDDRELFNKYNKCMKDLFDRNNANKINEDHLSSKESEEAETTTSNSNESKGSEENESNTTNSNESKESGERESSTSISNESENSAEIETTTKNSSESEDSGETESTTKNSSESEDNEEIESTVTTLNVSNEGEGDYNIGPFLFPIWHLMAKESFLP